MTRTEIAGLFELPFFELLHRARGVHARFFPEGEVQLSTLLSIKTGACPEDCGYCAQSARYETPVEAEPLMDPQAVVAEARKAAATGATRFCMGAGWRRLADRDLPAMEAMVRGVKALGLETCMTLGMMDQGQASRLKEAGLDYYNHNLDTSREYYPEVVGTRTYDDRVDTLKAVREAGLKVCSGGILGMGESRADRVGLLHELSLLPGAPESVPINRLVPIAGTPLAKTKPLVDDFEFVRCVAVARILFPGSHVRLSAGRETMDDALQALCLYAGANSIFYGERLLTTGNPQVEHDRELLRRLDLKPEAVRA
ncbi:MAG TPA: biotin synthase BioB [bacterium]|nr:biotin synthase BioB [bacterium]